MNEESLIEEELVFAPLSTAYNFKNLTGRTLFHWTILGYGGTSLGQSYWYGKCKCGFIAKVARSSLRSGCSLSCKGCR